MIAYTFRRYIWLINTIYSAGQITLRDISERWANAALNDSGECEYPRRTFQRHRTEIEELYNINIGCRKRGGLSYYYIANADELHRNDLQHWILNSFAVQEVVSQGQHIRSHILFEDIPSGQRFLVPIINAITARTVLEVTYQGYNRPEPHTFRLSPYSLRVFRQRWYVTGQSDIHTELRNYSLDRILALTPTAERYTIPRSFSAKRYFRDYYGIFRNAEPETVLIRTTPMLANYLRSLPLHHSQKETERRTDYSLFSFFVAPTFDFIQQLRSEGTDLQVLQPQWLRDRIISDARQLLAAYDVPVAPTPCKEE